MQLSAEEIKAARERLQLTQGELAQEVGVSLRTISNWERGSNVPRNRMGALVEALGFERGDEPESVEEALGKLVTEARTSMGLSKEKLAEIAGVAKNTLLHFEQGKRMPFDMTQRKIERALGWREGSIREVELNASEIDPKSLTVEDMGGTVEVEDLKRTAVMRLSNEDLLGELGRRLGVQLMTPLTQDSFGLVARRTNRHDR